MPRPVNYKEKVMTFKTALKYLKDPDIPAKIKNQYLMNIIDRIDYERPPIIRITKKNEHLYKVDKSVKGSKYHREPYKIKISLK